jgi:UDP-N-acetylbacillosamine N-acetyltransferase
VSELIIYGAGGHAVSVANIALYNNPDRQLRFVDPFAEPGKIFGFDVVTELPDDIADDAEFFAAIGDNAIRERVAKEIKDEIERRKLGRASLVSIIAKVAFIGEGAAIGEGAFVGQGAHIGPLAKIGRNAIINTHAILDHEVRLGDNCQICPNATLAGRVVAGNNLFVGINGAVIDNIKICDDVIIGASSTVIDHVTESGTYVGSPIRKVK